MCWAVRSPEHDPTLPLSAASLMMSARTMYAGGMDATVGFRMDAEIFVATLTPHTISIRRADPNDADVTFEADQHAIATVIYGGLPLADAEANGSIRLIGNRSVAEDYVTRFPLPAKLGAESSAAPALEKALRNAAASSVTPTAICRNAK